MGICSGIFGCPDCLLTDHTKGASIRRSFCDPIKNKYLIRKVGPYLVFISFLFRLWSWLVQPSDLIMVNRDVIMFRKIGKMLPVSCGAGDPEGARIPCCLVAMLLSLCINHPPFSVPVYKVRVSLCVPPSSLLSAHCNHIMAGFWEHIKFRHRRGIWRTVSTRKPSTPRLMYSA